MRIFTRTLKYNDTRKTQYRFNSLPKVLLKRLDWSKKDKIGFYISGNKLLAFKLGRESKYDEDYTRTVASIRGSDYPLRFSTLPKELITQLKWEVEKEVFMADMAIHYNAKILVMSQSKKSLDVMAALQKDSFTEKIKHITKRLLKKRQTKLRQIKASPNRQLKLLKEHHLKIITKSGKPLRYSKKLSQKERNEFKEALREEKKARKSKESTTPEIKKDKN